MQLEFCVTMKMAKFDYIFLSYNNRFKNKKINNK